LFREITEGDGLCNLCNGSNLGSQVCGELIDNTCELAPGAFNINDMSLTAELAIGADLLTDSGDFAGKELELVDHGVDDILELNHDEALYRDGNFLRKVATSDGIANAGDVLDLGLEEFELLDGRHAGLKGCMCKRAHGGDNHGRRVIGVDHWFTVCVKSKQQRPATPWTVMRERRLGQRPK